MAKFLKKRIEIEAIQFDGINGDKIVAWASPQKIEFGGDTLLVHTLEGVMTAAAGDWIIRGIKGEIYPCRADIFEATYDLSEPSSEKTRHPAVESVLQFFTFTHLPPHLARVSKPFFELAGFVADGPANPETTVALRKLLEAKDAAVRAVVAKF